MTMDAKIIRWPAFIVGLGLAFAAFSWWSLTRAASNVSAVTDSGYYHHGLAYDSISRGLLAAEALGWEINPRVNGRRLTIQVDDARHAAVSGAHGFISVHEESAAPGSLPMTDAGQGRYTVDLPAGLSSPLAATLTLAKDGATLQRRLLIALEH